MSLCQGFLPLFVGKAARGRHCSSPLPTPALLMDSKGSCDTAGSASTKRDVGEIAYTWYVQSQHKHILPDGKSTSVAKMQGWVYRLLLEKQKQM